MFAEDKFTSVFKQFGIDYNMIAALPDLERAIVTKNIQTYVKKQLKELKINTTELYTVIPQLYAKIKKEFSNKTLLNNYFGIDNNLNGYLQKSDVYSLGITLYEFLDSYTNIINIKNNLRLHDLLKRMLELNPENRYNALQCLNHPYFK
jgi:serine/threonine protein kinase